MCFIRKKRMHLYILLLPPKVRQKCWALISLFSSDSIFYIAQKELAQLLLLSRKAGLQTSFCLGYAKRYII